MTKASLRACLATALLCLGSGCSEDGDPEREARAEGTHFLYDSTTCASAESWSDRFEGRPCDFQRSPVLLGAEIELLVTTPSRMTKASRWMSTSLRMNDAQVDVHTTSSSLVCRGYGQMDSPEFLRDCDPTRRLEVHRWKVRTKTAGFIDVAVIDTEDEAVLTRRSVEVVEPVGLLLAVSQKSQPDGSYSLRVGSTLRISARPAGKADEPLLGRDSVTFTWSDDAIVSSTTTANVNAATARRPGTATLTIASGAVQQRVVVNAFDY